MRAARGHQNQEFSSKIRAEVREGRGSRVFGTPKSFVFTPRGREPSYSGLYFIYMLFLSLLSPRGCLVVFPDTKTDFFFLVSSYDVQFFLGSFEADFGLSLGRVLCHVYG